MIARVQPGQHAYCSLLATHWCSHISVAVRIVGILAEEAFENLPGFEFSSACPVVFSRMRRQ
jgi:hypothetical protein